MPVDTCLDCTLVSSARLTFGSALGERECAHYALYADLTVYVHTLGRVTEK